MAQLPKKPRRPKQEKINLNWRKKWEKNWNEVKYCSERCKRSKNKV